MNWLDRMSAALGYIEEQMMEDIDIDEVARHAISSTFHFQRMFHMLTGITVAEYVRRRRLTLAAQELASTHAKVVDIAFKYGYESPEAFAKAFRKAHGLSPSEARQQGVILKAYAPIAFHLSLKGDQEMEYQIGQRPAFEVTGKRINVSHKEGENLRTIPAFWNVCEADGSLETLQSAAADGVLLGVCMENHPQSEVFQYAIAVESNRPLVGDQWTTLTIPASTWAKFTSVGTLPNAIHTLWSRIFEEWFPATGYEHTGGPELEVCPPGDPLAADYRCEVWIPVVRRG